MKLSQKDGELFYKLWLPLLDYVNEKYGINPSLTNMAEAESLNPQEVKEVADRMWDDVTVIDEYLSVKSADILEENKEIIRSWKRRIRGEFVLERHLKKGSMFISMEDEKVYQVSGIISSWEEMFRYAPMPIVMKVTFMPFRDVIISDGLIVPYNVVIGPTMKRGFKETYMAAKKNNMIHRTL